MSTATYGAGNYGAGNYPPSYAPLPDQDIWIFAEDEGLKAYLTGLTVSDKGGSHGVQVWFTQPDQQIQSQNYPFLTLDLLDIVENKEQVHTTYPLVHVPDEFPTLPTGSGYSYTTLPVTPMLLTYQITSWCRHPRHDRQIMQQLFHRQLHPQYGEVPIIANGTMRRLIVRSFAKRDTTDEGSKRLFRNIWTVQMTSEMYYDAVAVTPKAQTVTINDVNLPKTPPASVGVPVLYP